MSRTHTENVTVEELERVLEYLEKLPEEKQLEIYYMLKGAVIATIDE